MTRSWSSEESVGACRSWWTRTNDWYLHHVNCCRNERKAENGQQPRFQWTEVIHRFYRNIRAALYTLRTVACCLSIREHGDCFLKFALHVNCFLFLLFLLYRLESAILRCRQENRRAIATRQCYSKSESYAGGIFSSVGLDTVDRYSVGE